MPVLTERFRRLNKTLEMSPATQQALMGFRPMTSNTEYVFGAECRVLFPSPNRRRNKPAS
ncbi:hypothetical protein QTP88_011780 [Uroleucon formosanum]